MIPLRRAAFGVVVAAALGACAAPTPEREPGTLVVSKEQQASWSRNFNPLLGPDLKRWPSSEGIYEPLLIWNPMAGDFEPWLAQRWQALADGPGYAFTVREGVRWSDGRPFRASDVAFTFELLDRFPALDLYGLWRFIDSVVADDEAGVVTVRLSEPFSPALGELALQPIVPEHVWAGIDDPVTFTNPDPIATGPFTEVLRFDPQLFELGRNPDYWQPGVPAVQKLSFPALPSNEQANLALIKGEIDWSGNFVPAIERTYVARDPEHHGYWFPAVSGAVYLYPNTTVTPLHDPRVRKGLSLALDRQLIVDVAMYGYVEPAPADGLALAYRRWMDGDVSTDWIAHDPGRAEQLLDEAGCPRGRDGWRRCGDTPLELELTAASGWSDWVRALQVISRNLGAVGVQTRVRTWDFGAWYGRLQRGEFELSLGWTADGATPYPLFRSMLGEEGVQPVGTAANGNWHRHAEPGADALLDAFAATLDRAEQRSIATQLQRKFAASAPAIPLFLSPSWGVFNRKHFVGWPTAEHPYARLSPNHIIEPLLVLTRVRPRGQS